MNSRNASLLVIATSSLLFGLSVDALPTCTPRTSLMGDLGAFLAPLDVNMIDDAERRTAQAYAAEHGTTEQVIKDRYAATGDLECGGSQSQANVTLVSDIITTSAHSIYGSAKSECIDLGNVPKCTFTVEVDGKKIKYQTDSLVDAGRVCGRGTKKENANDWAIVRLTKDVDSRIKPYKIDPDFRLRMKNNTPVVAIGRSIDFPTKAGTDLFTNHPRHYGDCATKQPLGAAVMTNCDLSSGSSGGALVTPGPDPVLVGVHQGENLGTDSDCPKFNPAKKSGPFSLCWGNTSTLVAADFAAALKRAAEDDNLGR